jgi:parallel beta-helix repeat protein
LRVAVGDHRVAESGDGTVQIPAGTFALRRGLVLQSGVVLVGAGKDKTKLVPDRRTLRLEIIEVGATTNEVIVDQIPEDLQVGSAVVASSRYPPSWYGAPRPAWITAIDRSRAALTLQAPYGLPTLKPGEAMLTWGDAMAIDRDVRQGDTEITLMDASLVRPGDELSLGEPPNESLLAHVFVKEVRDRTAILEQPACTDFPAWPPADKIGNKKVNALVWALFPLIHAANVEECGIRDLTVAGHGFDSVCPMQTRYTLAGIHIFKGKRVVIERSAVRNWPSDGISLQAGSGCKIEDCEITGCLGNGLHPGTSLADSVFQGNLLSDNGVGIYFCWHNERHVIRQNQIFGNRGGGITGLGNPGDRENIIEDNRIAENGGPGIEINGGRSSGNVIRNNTIENNSQEQLGKHPGIALYAAVEDARQYTIEGNIIRDTQAEPTQHIGVEERHGMYRDKPTRADENVITGNKFAGHRDADVVLAGTDTRCEDNLGAVIRRSHPATGVKDAD